MASEPREETNGSLNLPAELDEWLDERSDSLGVERTELVVQILASYHAAATLDGQLDAAGLLNLDVEDFVDVETAVESAVHETVPDATEAVVDERMSGRLSDRLDDLVAERVEFHLDARLPDAVAGSLDERTDEIVATVVNRVEDRLVDAAVERVEDDLPEQTGNASIEQVEDELVDDVAEQVEDALAERLRDDVTERVERGLIERIEGDLIDRFEDELVDVITERVEDALVDRVQEELADVVAEQVEADLAERIRDEVATDRQDAIENLDGTIQAKIEDVRDRIIQVKREADGKAPANHSHEQFGAIDARLDALAGDVAEVRDAFSERLDDHADTTADLTERVDDAEEKLNRVAWVVSDLKDEARGRDANEKAVDRIKRAAAQEGLSTADCERCGETVHVGLLTDPTCPHCDAAVSDVRPSGGIFRTKARLVPASQLESGDGGDDA